MTDESVQFACSAKAAAHAQGTFRRGIHGSRHLAVTEVVMNNVAEKVYFAICVTLYHMFRHVVAYI